MLLQRKWNFGYLISQIKPSVDKKTASLQKQGGFLVILMALYAENLLADGQGQLGLSGGDELTQKEVADRLGISQSYISRLEKRIISRLKKEILRLSWQNWNLII